MGQNPQGKNYLAEAMRRRGYKARFWDPRGRGAEKETKGWGGDVLSFSAVSDS